MAKKSNPSHSQTFSHIDDRGHARMVDVGDKDVTVRRASAEAIVHVGAAIAEALREGGGLAKGDVLGTARIAGIQAAKQTAVLVPMCHPIGLDVVEIDATVEDKTVRIVADATARARTGVEMEALTAVSVAALTVYDMCKSAEKGIEIGPIRLLEKSGGRSGEWKRDTK